MGKTTNRTVLIENIVVDEPYASIPDALALPLDLLNEKICLLITEIHPITVTDFEPSNKNYSQNNLRLVSGLLSLRLTRSLSEPDRRIKIRHIRGLTELEIQEHQFTDSVIFSLLTKKEKEDRHARIVHQLIASEPEQASKLLPEVRNKSDLSRLFNTSLPTMKRWLRDD